jgi:hypothetical protein
MICFAPASLWSTTRRELPFVRFVRDIETVIERIEKPMGFVFGDHQGRREK